MSDFGADEAERPLRGRRTAGVRSGGDGDADTGDGREGVESIRQHRDGVDKNARDQLHNEVDAGKDRGDDKRALIPGVITPGGHRHL